MRCEHNDTYNSFSQYATENTQMYNSSELQAS